jgi:hypothetical protein
MITCRGCGGPIRWTRTENNRAMPIDPDPDPDGNVAVLHTPEGFRSRVLRRGEDPLPGEAVHQSHFATCPVRAPQNPPPVPAGVVSLSRHRDAKRRAAYTDRYRR